jgi:16S rRNA (guanine1207-N2)-methyltransferase
MLAVYGHPLPALLSTSQTAVQFSPLVPGSASLEEAKDFSVLVMHAPAGTLERRYAMALALRALKPGAPFTIHAPRDKGGTRIAKELRHFGCVVGEDAKYHHRICRGNRPDMLSVDDAIAEGAPRFDEALKLWTQPGVFSWDRIDAGSALLVEHLPPLAGRGADFGCGIGFLSRAVLASPAVTHLTLLDIDRRAVAQAAKNIDTERAAILWRDVTKETSLSGLDFVIMNPPFHDGGIEDRTLGQRFIERAAAALRSGGVLWMVANRHLPYESVLQPLFYRVTLKAERDGFKLYEAVK